MAFSLGVQLQNGSPRILVVRLSSIGDVVRVLPALELLRKQFPEGRIDFAVERKSANVLENHHALDNLLVLDRPANDCQGLLAVWKFARQIRDNHYDLLLD